MRLFKPGDKVKIIPVDRSSYSPEFLPRHIGKTAIVAKGDAFNSPIVEVKIKNRKRLYTYHRLELKLLRKGCGKGKEWDAKKQKCKKK